MKKTLLILAAVLCALATLPAAGAVLPGALALGMTGVVLDCPAFDNVVADGVATAKLDPLIGRAVDRLILQLGGTALTKAMLTNIRLLANEKPIFEDTGARIDDRNEYRGITANAAFLTLDFNEIRAHSNVDKQAGALDTLGAGIRKLVLECTIAGATAPTLAARAMVSRSPQSSNALYNALLAKVLNRTQNFAAAGEFPMALNYAQGMRSFLKRVHLFSSTVTAVRVRKTYKSNITDEIFKGTDAQNDFVQTEYGRVPQANVFTVDFMPDGDVTKSLALEDAQAMEWLVTVSGAGNVVMVSELLDPLNNN